MGEDEEDAEGVAEPPEASAPEVPMEPLEPGSPEQVGPPGRPAEPPPLARQAPAGTARPCGAGDARAACSLVLVHQGGGCVPQPALAPHAALSGSSFHGSLSGQSRCCFSGVDWCPGVRGCAAQGTTQNGAGLQS